MADQSAAGSSYGELIWHPGNSDLPALPATGAPTLGKLTEFGLGADTPFISQRGRTPQPSTGQGAAKATGFADWFVDKLWVTPVPMAFGDISSQQDYDLTVYSTFKDEHNISAVDIVTSGLSLITPASLPVDLLPFGDEIFTFRVAQDGPESFNDLVTFTSDVSTFTVQTTGQRVLLMFATPQNGAREQLIFNTDLMRSKDGKEQAFSLRDAPRVRIGFTYRLSNLEDAKRTELESILMGGGPTLPIGVQYWWEARTVTSAALSTAVIINVSTENMSISVGDTIAFSTPDKIDGVGAVSSFNASSITLDDPIGTALPLGTFIMPVRFGRLDGGARTQTAQKNIADLSVTVITEKEAYIGAVDPTYFDLHPSESPGRPILKQRCISGRSASGGISRNVEKLDGKTGPLFVSGTEPLGQQTMQAMAYINSLDELYAWRQFLHYVRGSQGTFYAPSFQNDLPLSQALSLGGNTLIVPYMGITKFLDGAAPRRDLRIVTQDGSVYYRRITNAVDGGTGTETITVDSVVGVSGSSAVNSTFISWMHLVRLVGDSAIFTHNFFGEADLSFAVRTAKE